MRRFGSWLGVVVLIFSLLLPTSSYIVPQVAEAKDVLTFEQDSKTNVDIEEGFTFANNRAGKSFVSVGDTINIRVHYDISFAPDNGIMKITLQRYIKGEWKNASDTLTKEAGDGWKSYRISKDRYGKDNKMERGAMYRLLFDGPHQKVPNVNNQVDYTVKQNNNPFANIASRIEIHQGEHLFDNNYENAHEWTSNGKPILLNVWYDIAGGWDTFLRSDTMTIQLKRWEGGKWKVVWEKKNVKPIDRNHRQDFTITREKNGDLLAGKRYKLYFDGPNMDAWLNNRVQYKVLQLDAVHGADESREFDLAPKKLENRSVKMVMHYTQFSDKTGNELEKDLKMKGEVEFTYQKSGSNQFRRENIVLNKEDGQDSFTFPDINKLLSQAGKNSPNYTDVTITYGGMIDRLELNNQHRVTDHLKLGHQKGSDLKFKKVNRDENYNIELEVEGSLKDVDGVWTISLLDTDDNRLLSNEPIEVEGSGDKLVKTIESDTASTYHDEVKIEVTFQAVKVQNKIQANNEEAVDKAILYNSSGSKTVKFSSNSSSGGSSGGDTNGSSGGDGNGSGNGQANGGDDKGGSGNGHGNGGNDKGGSGNGHGNGGNDKGGSGNGKGNGGNDKGGSSNGQANGGDDKGGDGNGQDNGGDDKGEGGNGQDNGNDEGDSNEEVPVTIEANHSVDKQGNLIVTASLKDVENANGNWKITYDQQSEDVSGGKSITYTINKNRLKNGTTPLILEFSGQADGKQVNAKLELDVEVQGIEDNGSGNTDESRNDSTGTGNNDTGNGNGANFENTSNTPTSNGSTTIGGPLPKTANTYPLLLVFGTACLVLGGTMWYYMRRRTQ